MRSVWLSLLALSVLLAGCAGGTTGQMKPEESAASAATPTPAVLDVQTPAWTPAPAVSPVPAPSVTRVPTATPAPPATPAPEAAPTPSAGPGREEVLAAYQQAREAWGWFHVAPLDCDRTVSREVDGEPYWQVLHPTIRSTAELQGYLKGLFSDEVAAELLPYGGAQYLDLNGELWVRAVGWLEEWPEEQVEVLMEEAPYAYTLLVDFPPETEGEEGVQVRCRYQQVGERWLFTSFFSQD